MRRDSDYGCVRETKQRTPDEMVNRAEEVNEITEGQAVSEDHTLSVRTGTLEDSMSEPLVWTPLAVVQPEFYVDSELGFLSDQREDISIWAKRRAKDFRKFLGVSFSGFEDKIMDLLLEIERKRRSSEGGSGKKNNKSRDRGKRELKQLCSSLNFEKLGKKGGEGRRSRSFS